MKNSVIACLVLLLSVACGKSEDVIEIYLLKKRIRSHEGIPVLDYVDLKNIPYDGMKTIQELKPDYKYGVQFVICVDKEVCFTGYFRENHTSNIFNWNYLGYDYEQSELKIKGHKNFVLKQNRSYFEINPVLTNLKEYPKLVAAFRNTNRLKE